MALHHYDLCDFAGTHFLQPCNITLMLQGNKVIISRVLAFLGFPVY